MSFEGFELPKENYSKLPHEFIDQLPRFKSASEIKVVLYILRHTWGYRDDEKRITLDEFEKGRKKRDGSRIDSGVGMARGSIRLGLRQAEAHGFIRREPDGRDAARRSFYYSLIVRNSPSGGQELTRRGSRTDRRSEKETKKENNKKPFPYGNKTLTPEQQQMAEREQRARDRMMAKKEGKHEIN